MISQTFTTLSLVTGTLEELKVYKVGIYEHSLGVVSFLTRLCRVVLLLEDIQEMRQLEEPQRRSWASSTLP